MFLWIEIIVAIFILGVLAVKFGFLPPPHATLVIKIRGKQLLITRGRLRPQTREFITDTLREADIKSGFLAVTPEKWVAFSYGIPKNLRQRLRNVLLNV